MQTAYIGMGGNLASSAGAPEETFSAAALRLESLGRVTRRSSLYSTAPVGFAAQPRFVNAAIALETELAPLELLNGLLAIEKEFVRDRAAGFANGPRTLDLDILLLGDLEIRSLDLLIPHPRLAQRAFVLTPLNEIAPDIVVPGCGKTVAQLMDSQVSQSGLDAPGDSDAVTRIGSDGWPSR